MNNRPESEWKMPNFNSNKATAVVELILECQSCGNEFELSDPSGEYQDAITSGDYSDIVGSEERCPRCGDITVVDGIRF